MLRCGTPNLMPAWPGASDSPAAGEMQAIVGGEDLLGKNVRKKAERAIESQRAELVAMGLDPAAFNLPTLPPEGPPPSLEQALEMAKQAEAEAEAQVKRAEEERAKNEEELRRSLVEQGLDPEPVLERMRNPEGGPPRFSAEKELQKLAALSEELTRSGQDGGEFAALASDSGIPAAASRGGAEHAGRVPVQCAPRAACCSARARSIGASS